MINIEDNSISRDIYLEIRDSEEIPNIEEVNKVSIVQQVKLVLVKYYDLYRDTSYKVIRRGEYRDKIQEIKKEFIGIINIVVKLYSRGEIA